MIFAAIWMTQSTKEYIFGMLFLKRLPDLFEQEHE
jgi:type I restriction-modification system DNA methylase subunit